MSVVNVHQAKTHLSRLLAQVEKGEEVIIARSGKPIARLVAIEQVQRQPGRLKGRIRMMPNFDDPLPAELLRAFGAGKG